MKNLKKILSPVLVLAMMFSIYACSNKLPEETVPSTTPTTASETTIAETEPVVETTEAAPTPTEPQRGPNSTALVTERPVDKYGKLYVEGTYLMSSVTGEPVQLKGMSTYSIHATANFFNDDTITTLAEDWGCDILRIAMYTYASTDGYIKNPENMFNKMCAITDICIDKGIYVICDWHILDDGDPNEYIEESKDFFNRYTAIYGDCDNIIYEVCNEPNGECFDNPDVEVTWDGCIKPYAEQVIPVIRANAPDSVIIVGTGTWSQDVDLASQNPIDSKNIMYTAHFYAGSHGQEYRDKVQVALDNNCAVFVTEWGTTMNTGSNGPYTEESDLWLQYLEDNYISWCNWSIGSSASETSNALLYWSNVLDPVEKIHGHWPDEFLSQSGNYVRSWILKGKI